MTKLKVNMLSSIKLRLHPEAHGAPLTGLGSKKLKAIKLIH